ncbi:MAG: hypothetical protein IJ880_16415 [Bacilli bacterium]|nr:hypothetical protein [Bacilli bacterium]
MTNKNLIIPDSNKMEELITKKKNEELRKLKEQELKRNNEIRNNSKFIQFSKLVSDLINDAVNNNTWDRKIDDWVKHTYIFSLDINLEHISKEIEIRRKSNEFEEFLGLLQLDLLELGYSSKLAPGWGGKILTIEFGSKNENEGE